MGPVPQGAACRAPPSRASVVHRQLLLLCRASPAVWGGCAPPPRPRAHRPCVLAALHPHATVTATHSTGQAHYAVGFEPSSAASATGQLPCGALLQQWVGTPAWVGPAWVGRHMLLGRPRPLDHRGCRQDPQCPEPEGGAGRQPVASPAQAQSCTPALQAPAGRAPGGDPQHHQGPRGPCADCPGEQGLDGRVGVGAIRENRALRVRAAMGACPTALPAPTVCMSGRGPRRRGPCPGPLTRDRVRGRGLGGAAGRSAQAFLCAHRCQRPQSGVPQPAPTAHGQPV